VSTNVLKSHTQSGMTPYVCSVITNSIFNYLNLRHTMKKLQDLKGTLAAKVLTIEASVNIKGGTTDATEDEKRRQRPGGNGISTNSTTPSAMGPLSDQ
jgi:hypothetical protein